MAAVITRLYGAAYDYPYMSDGPSKSVMIATIPRAGSTHFCSELWRTGAMGAPMEYLNFLNRMQDMVPRLGDNDILEYWDRLQAVRTSPNGVFTYKTFPQDFQQIENKCPPLIAKIAPDYVIYLTRRDKLKQAVSYSRAYQTNAWFADAQDQAPAVYNRDGIENALRWISQLENRWESLFNNTSCEPCRITYEDIIDNPLLYITQVTEFCDVKLDSATQIEIPSIAIQSDNLSSNWIERYNNEL